MPRAAALQKAPDLEWRNRQPGMTYRRLGAPASWCLPSAWGATTSARGHRLRAVGHGPGLNYFDTAPQYGGGQSERGYALVHKARGRDKAFQSQR